MKYIVVTGASSGFGFETTKLLLECGNILLAIARNIQPLNELQNCYPNSLFPVSVDVTDKKSICETVKSFYAKYGRIDTLFSNAGYIHFGPFEETTEEQMRREMEVNFWGSVNVIQSVLPYMRKARSGHIIQTTSIGGIVSYPFSSFYHASKWALEGLLSTIAQEVDDFGINITMIEPGNFATNLIGAKKLSALKNIDYSESFLNHIDYCNNSNADAEDPMEAAKEIVKIINTYNPPLRTMLGNETYSYVKLEYEKRLTIWNKNKWEDRKI